MSKFAELLNTTNYKKPIKVAVVGDVDAGKSTLVGLILNAFNPELYKLTPKEEYKITDSLREETNNNKTIKSSRYKLTDNLILINCPGHLEYKLDITSSIIEADYVIYVFDTFRGITCSPVRTKSEVYITCKYLNKKVIYLYNEKMENGIRLADSYLDNIDYDPNSLIMVNLHDKNNKLFQQFFNEISFIEFLERQTLSSDNSELEKYIHGFCVNSPKYPHEMIIDEVFKLESSLCNEGEIGLSSAKLKQRLLIIGLLAMLTIIRAVFIIR